MKDWNLKTYLMPKLTIVALLMLLAGFLAGWVTARDALPWQDDAPVYRVETVRAGEYEYRLLIIDRPGAANDDQIFFEYDMTPEALEKYGFTE